MSQILAKLASAKTGKDWPEADVRELIELLRTKLEPALAVQFDLVPETIDWKSGDIMATLQSRPMGGHFQLVLVARIYIGMGRPVIDSKPDGEWLPPSVSAWVFSFSRNARLRVKDGDTFDLRLWLYQDIGDDAGAWECDVGWAPDEYGEWENFERLSDP
jgi:hypothetical protein